MYLLSRSPGLTLPLRDNKTEYHPQTGAVLKVHPALSVQFQRAGAPNWARDAVHNLPGWGNGLAEHEDPFARMGVLDTDEEAVRQNWTPEEKEYVENALRNASSNGIEYVICTAPRATKPWDKYDEFVGDDAADKILYTIELIGADPAGTLQYERENANRPEVVEALEALVARNEEDVVGVINA